MVYDAVCMCIIIKWNCDIKYIFLGSIGQSLFVANGKCGLLLLGGQCWRVVSSTRDYFGLSGGTVLYWVVLREHLMIRI